jgi:hypothetical protein
MNAAYQEESLNKNIISAVLGETLFTEREIVGVIAVISYTYTITFKSAIQFII